MPLQWPPSSPLVQNAVQLGVSMETEGAYGESALACRPLSCQADNVSARAAELVQKEGSKLAGRQEFAKRVAMSLYHFMESFSTSGAGNHLVLPTNVLERWFQRFDDKFKRDPDFLMHAGEKA